jgi:hypothetical protein
MNFPIRFSTSGEEKEAREGSGNPGYDDPNERQWFQKIWSSALKVNWLEWVS